VRAVVARGGRAAIPRVQRSRASRQDAVSRRPSRLHAIRHVSSQLSKSLLPAAPWMLRRVQLQTSYVRLRTVQRTVQQLRCSARM